MASALKQSDQPLDLLKRVLENLRFPERLDAHPWVRSLTVHAAAAENPSLKSKSPGVQLVLVLGDLFRQMMPATPPRREGKRLDTRWGRFGILAASYFAPLLYGRLYPHSLREAWHRIDQAILLFVYGLPPDRLRPEQIGAYQLLGKEVDLAANSTISDWHRDGLRDLAALFISREKSLSLSMRQPSAPSRGAGGHPADRGAGRKPFLPGIWPQVVYATLALSLIGAALGGAKAYRTFSNLQRITRELDVLRGVDVASLQPETLAHLGQGLARIHAELVAVQTEMAPLFWLTRQLGWIPVYGGDLKYADQILATGAGATDAAYQTYQVAMPIWNAVHGRQNLGAADLTRMLIDTAPALQSAQAALKPALAGRQRINDSQLSVGLRSTLARADPYLTALDGGISLALSVPALLGGTDAGPKTYLILVQNEDELRPTGGFITAVGKAVVRNGELMDLQVEDSYAVDNIQKAYPPAPWQMQSFMNIPIMVFRDTNWFTDYPTAVAWAEYLYAYTHSYSVDGVIAIDQHVLEKVLSVTGPVQVSGIDTAITSENVRSVMRAQKIPPAPEQRDPNWHRKQFMNPISTAILQRLITGPGVSWEQLLRAMLGELDERHILVQLDDPTLTHLLSQRGWDGAVQNSLADFLMVVDTNLGYNKANAVVSSRLEYDVDLTDTAAPRSSLTVFHANDARGQVGNCIPNPAEAGRTVLEEWYPIDRCYYDYLRVYVPAGTQLTAAAPHAVSRGEMPMLEEDVPARVDILDESIENVQGFGTLLVVPMQSSLETSFQFSLPAAVVQPGVALGDLVYELKIEKQAGTVAVPATLRLHLPPAARVDYATTGFIQQGNSLLFDLNLRTDANVRVEFRP